MRTRILTSIIGFICIAPMLFFSDTFALTVLLLIFTLFSTYEIMNCTGLFKKLYLTIPSYIALFGIDLLSYFARDRFYTYVLVISFGLFLYYLTVSTFSKGKISMPDAAITVVMLVYATIGFSSLSVIRMSSKYGLFMMLYAIFTPWFSDIGAYFVGMAIGKHKLIPEISPKKTVEGAVGGLILGTVLSIVFIVIVGLFNPEAKISYIPLVISGFLICLLSQCGDLVSSNLKRHYGIKDFGKLLPGHGGAMDRMDSVIYTTPIIAMLITLSDYFIFIK